MLRYTLVTLEREAAGPVGEHAVSIWRNSFKPIPYLNWHRGPYKDVNSGVEFKFRITPGIRLAVDIAE